MTRKVYATPAQGHKDLVSMCPTGEDVKGILWEFGN